MEYLFYLTTLLLFAFVVIHYCKTGHQAKLIPDAIALPYLNVRTRLSPKQWGEIRQIILTRNNCTCEICHLKYGESLHVHEKWTVDRKLGIQKLIGLMGLCPDCHGAFHILNSIHRGVGDKVIAHMLKVNDWRQSQADRVIAETKALIKITGKNYWLDLTYLNNKQFDFLKDEFNRRIIFTNKENRNCRNDKNIY